MSRTRAAGKRTKHGRVGGEITREMMRNWIQAKGVELRGAGTDESPHCDRRLLAVLEAPGDTIRVLHTLTPIVVAMAGEDEFDPYKDELAI